MTSECLFVCLFVGIKPEKLYSTSGVEREVNPLGAVTHGQRHILRWDFHLLLSDSGSARSQELPLNGFTEWTILRNKEKA